MSLLSRLGRVLKAEVGRRLPEKPTDMPFGAGTSESGTSEFDGDTFAEGHRAKQQHSHVDTRIAGYYAALELPFGADMTAVKQAHRRLMKRYHPDRFHASDKAETANEVTRRLNEAYDGLRQYLEADT
jgi:hypothetical protein